MASSLAPWSAASRICARLTSRTCDQPLPSISCNAMRSSSLSVTRYRTFIVYSPLHQKSRLTSPTMSSAPHDSTEWTSLQGQYLAFIYAYTTIHDQSPAERDMQQFFQVTPPSVHNM